MKPREAEAVLSEPQSSVSAGIVGIEFVDLPVEKMEGDHILFRL
jgi:hypothetical protein